MATIVSYILGVVLIYLIIGVFFALVFLWKGIAKIDEGAVDTSLTFKLIILPGVMTFWPVLAYKWLQA